MKAYLGNKTLKKELLAEARKHQKADKIIQGTYGDKNGWCAVGCTIHSYNVRRGKDYSTSDHSVYETDLGIPKIIAKLEDRIFEGLNKEEAKDFPVRFLSAIEPGADLTLVWYKFVVWLLADKKDGVIKYARPAGIKAIKKVVDLYQKHIDGKKVSPQQFRAADAYAAAAAAAADADAADAAAAAAAADADAYAAAAAAAADAAAAAAAAAADAADADADAARKLYYNKMADKLVELLKEAR